MGKIRRGDQGDKLNRALLAGWQAPDLLGIGVMVCDSSGRLLIANRTALDVLKAEDGLELDADRKLRAADEESSTITEMVWRCAHARPSAHKPADGCLSHTVRRTSGRAPFILLARPFRPASNRNAAMALVLVLESSLVRENDELLMRLVGGGDAPIDRHLYHEGVQ